MHRWKPVEKFNKLVILCLPSLHTATTVHKKVLEDGLTVINNSKRGNARSSSDHALKPSFGFLTVMMNYDSSANLDSLMTTELGKIIVTLPGRLNKYGVTSPRIDV